MMRRPRAAIGATCRIVREPRDHGVREDDEHARRPRPGTATLYSVARQTDVSARSGCPAPRFWPTSVAAAFASPHAGSSDEHDDADRDRAARPPRRCRTTRGCAPARSSSSSPISIWNTALPDSRTMLSITARIEPEMLAADDDAAVAARQEVQLHEHADAAAGRRRDRRAGDAESRKRAEPEDEARIEADVDRVGDPQHAHRDRRVAGAAEHGVDQEQHA